MHTGGTLLANIVTKFNAAGTASTNTTTGAVVITGGLGVSGTVYTNGLTANDANLTGIPVAPTAPTSTSNTQIATTAFVQANKGGAKGGGADSIFYENETTVTTSYTISSGKNASSVGPITINDGAIVTIPTGSKWVIF